MTAALAVERTARLHEKTVQNVAAGDQGRMFPRQRRRTQRGPGLVVAKVHPKVWAEVKRLAKHPSHIQIVSETKVVVWDRPVPSHLR